MPNWITFTLEDNEGNEAEWKLPAKFEICTRCRGEGKHVNPNVDGRGISAEEWENEWDEDSREGYLSGRYDVPCEAGCRDGKILVPDVPTHAPQDLKDLLADYEERQDQRARWDAEDRHTRRMESGGYDY